VSAASLSLSPSSGPAGTVVTAQGTGFVRNRDVLAFWHEDGLKRYFGVAKPDDQGTVTITFRTPTAKLTGAPVPVGQHMVELYQTGDPPRTPTMMFTVTSGATESPSPQPPTPTNTPRPDSKPRRAVIFLQGVSSYSTCPNGEGFLGDKNGAQYAPFWVMSYLGSQEYVTSEITLDSTPYYFSYGGYCNGGSGANGEIASYNGNDSCGDIPNGAFPRLRALIKSVTDKVPGTQVVLVGHSQGGFIATYTVGRLLRDEGEEGRAFVRQRIASIVTFDSFPDGLPDTLEATASLIFLRTCLSLDSPNYRSWEVGGRESKLAVWAGFPEDDGEQVEIYTIGAQQFPSVGSYLNEIFTTAIAERDHLSRPGDSHSSVWNSASEDKQFFVACAALQLRDCKRQQLTVAQNQIQTITKAIVR